MEEIFKRFLGLINWVVEPRKRRANFDNDFPSLRHKYRKTSYMDSPNREKPSPFHFGSLNDYHLRYPADKSQTRDRWESIKENMIEISDDEDDSRLGPGFPMNGSRLVDLDNKLPSKWHSHSNDEEEDDDVLYVTCLESNEAKAKRLGYKFFKSRHADSPSPTQSLRHSLYRPNFSANKIKRPIPPRIHHLTLHESFRLEDKKQYRELLKNTAPSFGSHSRESLLNRSSLYGTPLTTSPTQVDSRSRSRKLVEAAIKANLTNDLSLSSPLVDLTKPTSSKTPFSQFKSTIAHKSSPIVGKQLSPIDLSDNSDSKESSPILVKDSSDSEIECVASYPVKSPLPRSNSLKAVLDSKAICSDKWIQELTQKHNQCIKEKTKRIEEERLRKKLHAEQNSKLYGAALSERIQRSLAISDPIEVIELVTEDVPFPTLTAEQEEMINRALHPKPSSQVLVQKFNMNITRQDIHSLAGLNWLNDEVINFYMNLIMERSKHGDKPKVYATNTFFYPKLMSGGQASLRRWTKKVDVFAHEMMIVPIHINNVHWCMSVIDFRQKAIRYFDSMGDHNVRCVEALLQYLVDEMMDKKKQEFSTDGWTMPKMRGIPQQMNGSDCGMFSCTFAEFSARNAKFTFCQQDMPYLRRKMVYEIITGKLLMN